MRRGFLFLVCFGRSVPFISEHTNAFFESHRVSQERVLHQSCVHLRTAQSTRQHSTPRTRNQPPGPLLLQPHLTADKEGQTQFTFRLADTRTAYLSATGFAEGGRIGVAATDFHAFAPFLTELDLTSISYKGTSSYVWRPTDLKRTT